MFLSVKSEGVQLTSDENGGPFDNERSTVVTLDMMRKDGALLSDYLYVSPEVNVIREGFI